MRGLGQAPKVRVRLQGQNGSADLSVLPDTGADISENLLPSDRSQAYSVDGSTLRPIGQMTVKITLGEVTIEDHLHIFPKIAGGMPIS